MESSFFDDLLKRDVDQNAVNAIVGSLESQVTSVSGSGNKVTASSVQASNAVSNDGAKNATAKVLDSPATNHIQVSSRPAPVNGSTSVSEPVAVSVSQTKTAPGSRSSTPNKQSSSPIISANASSQQLNIAPKNMLSSTVPIAPRIVITPQQAQMLIEQRFAGTTLVPSNLVGNVRMAGAPVPLVPRMAGGPNTVTAVSSINMMTGQIPGMQNIVSRMQAPQSVILTQNIKQEASISTSPGTSPKPSGLTMQQAQAVASSVGLPSTTLTQVKGSSPVPGVVTYRFRQVNPTSVNANANANATNLAIMKESVKKLKEFFQNLISLACGANQPPEIGRSVKELVQNVMYNKMNEEEFVEKLQLTLKSDPQPNLVPFLKKTLPHLRETMKQQNKVQTVQPVQQAAKAQDSLQKIAPVATQAQLNKTQIASTINLAGNQKLLPNAIQATVMQMNSSAQRQLTPSQQMLLNRSIAFQQRQQLQKQIVQDDRIVTNPSGGKDITTVMKANFQGNAAHTQGLVTVTGAHAEKIKHKAALHYSSAMTSNDDDINDVTCMAGVNLMEESAKILSTGSELLGVQTRSCKDETFLFTEPLKRKIDTIVKRYNLREANQDLVSIVSHATEERLRNIMERLAVLSLHRVEAHKDHPSFEIVSDVKSQLRVFEQIDEVERKHREAREREMLMRVAKSRSRTEDPEQARLKEKAKQLQQEEEELLRKRAANKTALEAIGPRKKRKLDEALESLSTAYSTDASGSSEGASASQLQPMRLRTRRITLRDLQFILEQDKDSSKSSLVFKSYLR